MLLTEKHIKQFAAFFLCCFVLTYAWFAYHELLFSSVKPVFFLNKLDITHNIFMLTDLQHLLLQYSWLRIAFDILYFFLPVLLVFSIIKSKRWQTSLAIATAAFSVLYGSFFSVISFISPEMFLAWMFIPLVFLPLSVKGFYYAIHICRLLFIVFIFSAALWKIRGGGIFNGEEMSAILFRQHASYISLAKEDWYSKLITYLVNNQTLSWCFYLFAFIAEFVFVIGLFTKKADRFLLYSFLLFALFDYLLMGINYFTWLPFMGCFYFSRYKLHE